jgi:hypothetical protein
MALSPFRSFALSHVQVRGELLDSMQSLLSLATETHMLVVSTLREVAGPATVAAEVRRPRCFTQRIVGQ